MENKIRILELTIGEYDNEEASLIDNFLQEKSDLECFKIEEAK